MKTTIVSVVILASLLSACGKQGDISQNSVSLGSSNGIYSPNQVDQSLEKSKLSKAQRIKAIENLHDAFKQRYIGYTLKEKFLGKHPDKIFADCKDRETKSEEYTFSINFHDALLRCLAELKDSHLSLESSQTTIANFIADARFVKNKLIITELRSELIRMTDELNRSRLVDKLSIGDEVISIDDQLPTVAAADMEKYISSSSDNDRKKVATSRLFYRSFKYPFKKSLKIKVKNAKSEINEINLDWFIDDRVKTTLDSNLFLKKIGIDVLNLPSSVGLTEYGFNSTRKVFSTFENFRTYLDNNQDEVLRMGVAKVDLKKLCYIQPLSFQLQPENNGVLFPIHDKSKPNEKAISYITALKDFLSSCEREKQDLVLDLKFNPGGDYNLSERFFSMLEILSQSNIHYGYARNRDKSISDWIFIKGTSYEKEVFSGKVISLISGECKSACDLLALALKLSKRSIMIGEPTNGATFGFDLKATNTNFNDESGLITMKIPNYAFQILNVTDEPHFENIFDFSKLKTAENSSTAPDIALPLTVNDINSNFVDYRKRVLELVGSK